MTQIADVDLVLRALADPIRRLILDLLLDRNGQSLFDICVQLSENHDVNLSRQAISKHLNILETAGIIAVQWQGRTKFHFLDPAPIRQISEGWFKKFQIEDSK